MAARSLLLIIATLATGAFAQSEPSVTDAPSRDERSSRLRWGLSAGAGWHLGSSALGLGLGVEGHLGYRLAPAFAAYVSTGGVFSGGWRGQGADTRFANTLNQFMVSALGEATVGERLSVAVGPGLAVGRLALEDAPVWGTTLSVAEAGAVKPTVDLRCTLRLGDVRHSGFSVGLRALTVLYPNALLSRDGATTRGLFVDVTPMLMLGYEGR